MIGLKCLLRTIDTIEAISFGDTVGDTIGCLDGLLARPVELHLCVPNVSHISDTTLMLDVETGAYILQELIVGLEVLWMLHECLQHVCTIVIVSHAILDVRFVQVNLEVTRSLGEAVGGTVVIAVLSDVAFSYRVEVGQIVLVLRHRLTHLVCRHLHRGEGVAVGALVADEQVTRVSSELAIVGILDILEGVDRECRERYHLCHIVGSKVGARLWVLHSTDDSVV